MQTVGVIANPLAGKDIRRLTPGVGTTSDAEKVALLRQSVSGALEAGAPSVLLSNDRGGLGREARRSFGDQVQLVATPATGSRLDTVAAAQAMADASCGCVISFGGDGTCRDVATGWPDVPLIAVSSGTNNVFPAPLDATAAGVAAGLIARGAVGLTHATNPTKCLIVRSEHQHLEDAVDEIALVDVALIDTAFVGARAVTDPASIKLVVAAIAEPTSSGLSSIPGRAHPVDRLAPGGVVIHLGAEGKPLRVPLVPGTFSTIGVTGIELAHPGESISISGPGVLAFDGERHHCLRTDDQVTVAIASTGPRLVDVSRTLETAARQGLFHERELRGN